MSFCTAPTRVPRSAVVSLAEMAFSTSWVPWFALALLTIGTMFWAAKLDFGSVRMTKSLALIEGSVVKRSAASMRPFLSAVTVTGPPVSVVMNLLNVTP